ncbi:MAG: hypothetical protein ACJA2F_001067 [Nitriliruptoraceae bacterium]|jgi:hypothetical protein
MNGLFWGSHDPSHGGRKVSKEGPSNRGRAGSTDGGGRATHNVGNDPSHAVIERRGHQRHH